MAFEEVVHMAKFCPLYSGSSGNATFVGDSDGGILVDIGVSCKMTVDGLCAIDHKPEDIKAVFVTHEHSDHIKGVRVFLKHFKVPLFASAGTLQYLQNNDCIPEGVRCHVIPNGGVEVYGMTVTGFATSHDAAESLGYRIEAGERKIAIATDLGCITEEVQEAIIGSDLVMLESNYDLRMLEQGSYPYYLKRRIKGNRGHLSNEECADKLVDLVLHGTTRLYLGHLSKENNMPDVAFQTAANALTSHQMTPERDYILRVADRYRPSRPLFF